MDGEIPTGHGIEDEPQFRAGRHAPDPSELEAERTLEREASAGGHDRDEALASVFEESHSFLYRTGPSSAVFERDVMCAHCGRDLYGEVRGLPCPTCGHEPARVWRDWYERRRAGVAAWQSWMLFALVALFSGPLAIIGTLISGHGGGILRSTVFGPTIEEMLKIGVLAFLVETRPYLLRGAWQIRVAALASALAFATIENLVYIFWYLDDPSRSLVLWRWSVCTSLHVVATCIAAQGIVRVYTRSHRTLARPDLAHGFRWLVAAIALHALYNAVVLGMEAAGHAF